MPRLHRCTYSVLRWISLLVLMFTLLPPSSLSAAPTNVSAAQEFPPRQPEWVIFASSVAENHQPYVILDPGHGGDDPGAPSSALAELCNVSLGPTDKREKDVNLEVAQLVRVILEANGVRVGLTRETDITVDRPARWNFINQEQPDLAVSIHANSGGILPDGTYTCGDGVEAFYSSEGPGGQPNPHVETSRQLAQRLALKINQSLGLRLRRNNGIDDQGFDLVRMPTVPSSLVEMAFISNPDEVLLLRNQPGVFAQAIADAILEHLASAASSTFASALGINQALVQSLSFAASDSNGYDIFTTAAAGFPTQGDSYVVLSSGCTSVALIPNNSPSTSCELDGLNNQQGNDLVQMTLVLDVPDNAKSWSVQWKFFSEEFPEYVGSSFNDAFLIEKNSSNFTISGSTITAPNNVAFDANNNLITINTTGPLGMTTENATGTTYDGATNTLTTAANVPDGVTEITLIFSVMDLGDSAYDSTVFLDNFKFSSSPVDETGTAPTGGSISGHVLADIDGGGDGGITTATIQLLSGAPVQVCRVGGLCLTRVTDESGQYSVAGLPEGQYNLRAFPPAGFDFLQPKTLGPLDVTNTTVLENQDIVLEGSNPLPPGTSITSNYETTDGIPVVYWGQTLNLTTQGCANGSASYQVLQNGTVISSGPMAETPSGSGNYIGSIPPLFPNHGAAQVAIIIDCPGSNPDQTVDFDIYIDPSGFVKTVDGDPIEGATVTLFRSDSEFGPFEIVPDGSALMSPSNRDNPDTTDAEGRFGWDVIAGYYVVRAEKEGCHAPDNPDQAFVESEVLTIPPPVTDLDLRLACPEELPNASLSLSPATASFDVGDTFDIAILIDTDGARTSGTDVDLTFDHGKLTLLDIIPGTAYDFYLGENIRNDLGIATISGLASSTANLFTGTGTFATLRLKATGAGTAEVKFIFTPGNTNDTNIADFDRQAEILSSVTNGVYTIVEPIPVIINSLLNLVGTTTSYNPTPVANAPAGVFTIRATFKNISSAELRSLFFKVTTLTGGNVVLNANGSPGGVGSTISVPYAALTGDGILTPDESFTQVFEIGLVQRKGFTFLVDAYGIMDGVTSSAVDNAQGYAFEVPEDQLRSNQQERLYLPSAIR